MGKAAMCLRMLQVLNTGRLFRVSELAGQLDTNPRNIIEYKKELDEISIESGFYIDNISGRYGGYRLNGNAVIPALKLTVEEKAALVGSYKFLMSEKGYVDKKNLTDAYAKIMSNVEIDDKNLELISVHKTDMHKNMDNVKKWFKIIEKAMKEKKAILMEYEFLKEATHVVEVHPYQFFIYDDEWRFFGWSMDTNDVFYYKLSRIKNIEVTNKKFTVWKYFRPENYLKDGVFTQNGEMFHLTLIASGIRARLFKEKDFGKNQVCEDLPDGTTKVSLEMQKNHSTYNFILGCGDLVKVIEPDWLVDKIKELASKILEQYK